MDLFPGADLGSFAAANNEFAVGLYNELRAGAGNLFFSPYNIRSALTLAYAGARGRTASQMAEALRFPEAGKDLPQACRDFEAALASRSKSGAVEIVTANALWRQEGMSLLAPFVDLIRDAYGSEVFEADFAGSPAEAVRTINEWVKGKTHGRIPGLFGPDSFDSMTRLVLAAAVFFYGKWKLPFPASLTRSAPFRLTRTGETVEVPMMGQEGFYGYAKLKGFQALELPYIGGKMSMVVLLPDTPDGWESLEKELTAPGLARCFHVLRKVYIAVKMPKFLLESSFMLNEALEAMGLQDAFSPSADFGGMSLEKPLGIGAVIHKATAEVDEAGTTSAAASGIKMALGLPPQFLVDHPFLFVIRDISTDAILFMGRVLEPGGSGKAAIAAKPPRLLDRLLRALGLTR